MEHLEINHNLLSAYIDNDISEEERILIELAIEDEPQLAWEVATLQQTVSMLNSLSEFDFPLFTKPPGKTQFESSSIKPAQLKVAAIKLIHPNQIQHGNSGKPEIKPSKAQLRPSYLKKSHHTLDVVHSLRQKFNLAQQIFWHLGSPFWRGIAIIGLLLLLLLLGSDLFISLVPFFKTVLIKAQYTTQINISTIQSTGTSIGLGTHRTYLLIIYLIISTLTFMSTMLWWRSNPYH